MREQHVIRRLGHQGDGIADGPLYVPLTLPGETVSGLRERDRLNEVRIVTPSDSRVTPPCRHFKTCGGCQLQHASDAFVAAWKTDIVRQALAACGLQCEFRPIHVSPPHSRRRAVFSARRTKKGAMSGFHIRASDQITPIPDCVLLHPDLMRALSTAEALARSGASRRGELHVTATVSTGGLDISVEGGIEADGPFLLKLGHEADRLDLARLTWNGDTVVTRRPPLQRFGPAQVTPPPGSFLQATEAGERALLAAVTEIVGQASRVADLFAGCGTFSLPLATVSEVHAVEGTAEMIAALDQGWRHATGLKKVTTEARDLFRRPLLPEELRRFDACVIDPPRAGAEAQVTELARSGVPVIAYVSCNPATFARDARTLADAGYALEWVQVVDQFRWSAHVELVARLVLKTA
jgi:23S rRNA (uracil1939-C5)-methyltransferase